MCVHSLTRHGLIEQYYFIQCENNRETILIWQIRDICTTCNIHNTFTSVSVKLKNVTQLLQLSKAVAHRGTFSTAFFTNNLLTYFI